MQLVGARASLFKLRSGGFYSWALKLEDDHQPTVSTPVAVHNKLLYIGEITVYGAVSHLLDFIVRREC